MTTEANFDQHKLDITLARHRPKERKTWLPSDNFFAGVSTIEKALFEGTEIQRLSVRPSEKSIQPASYAVIKELDWQKETAKQLPFNFEWTQPKEGRYDFSFDMPAHMKCLGLGERFSGLDLRGGTHTLIATDNPNHNEAMDPMYVSIPLLILSHGNENFALFLDSPAPQRWHLDPDFEEKGHIELFTRRGWQMYLIGPTSLPNIVKTYTHLTGRAALPPRWALGHFQCRWSYPDETTVRKIAQECRERKIPSDVIVLDVDYMDDYRVFTTSEERFPDMKKLVEDLAKDNLKVVTIIDPGVKEDPKYKIFQEGVKQNFFCKTLDGKVYLNTVWPGVSAFPDFLKSATREWWAQHLKFYIDKGIVGIWNDMNEPAFFNTRIPFAPGLDEIPLASDDHFVQEAEEGEVGHLEVRNLYGSLMCQATHEGLLALEPTKRPFVLTRSAYAGIQRYSACWLGDNHSFFEHLANSIPMLLNMGLSGVAFTGSDIGGFGKDADSDLLIRWYELGIFYPFYRNHSMLGSKSQEPWAHNPFVEKNCRKLIETRYRLLPYIQSLFWEHLRTGAPLMRPLSWHYPSDKYASEIDHQFLFGQDILVAPVVRRGHTQRMVYFPEGIWHPFEGGEPIVGGKAEVVELKLGSVPAFIRDGAIIAFAQVMQSTVDYDQSPITFACYGDNASGVYFEDDGQSLDWQNGTYNEWNLNAVKGTLTAKAAHKEFKAPKREFHASYKGKTKNVTDELV